MSTDKNSAVNENNNSVVYRDINKLNHYGNHPFKLYEGERQKEMIESIKAHGILMPLTIRQDRDGEYEILAGHNRFECGNLAGLTEVPCIEMYGLTDEEAHQIVIESNLMQRGFSDFTHSERAEALATYYEAIKHQGKRTDLIKQFETILNGDTNDDEANTSFSDSSTCSPVGKKSINVAGEKYGLSKNTVARYLRVNSLIHGFKKLLDSEELSLRAGVSLSYVENTRQEIILNQMQRYETRISMKQAEQLKQLATETLSDSEDNRQTFLLSCVDILLGRNAYEKEQKPKNVISFKIQRSIVKTYFKEEDTDEDIQKTIIEALEFYHQSRNNTGS